MKATSFFGVVFALAKRWSKIAMWVIFFWTDTLASMPHRELMDRYKPHYERRFFAVQDKIVSQ